MKIFYVILVSLLASDCSASSIKGVKDFPVIEIDSSWAILKDGVYIKENMEISDYNNDGNFDYFRLQDPPNSYQHWIWLDTDHDGFFDTYNGNNGRVEGLKIRVPKLQIK